MNGKHSAKNVIFISLTYLQVSTQTQPLKYTYETFRGTRIVNGHSIETLRNGEMEMIIGHRFGRLNGGGYELFGLDQASIRLCLLNFLLN